jgi:tetratricopeptide (TPR) repeat protein
MELHQFEKAVQIGLIHLDAYNQFKEGKVDKEKLLFGGCDSIGSFVHNEMLFNLSKCYFQVKDYDNAMLYFDKINLSIMGTIINALIQVGLALASKSGQYDRVADLYAKIQQTKIETRQIDFMQGTEVYIQQKKDERGLISDFFSRQEISILRNFRGVARCLMGLKSRSVHPLISSHLIATFNFKQG